MRILVCSDKFGGYTTTFIYNEVMALSKLHTVKYVSTKRENPEKYPFGDLEVIPDERNKIYSKILWWLEIFDINLIFKDRKFSKRINSIIEEFKPDIIHCHFGYEALRFIDNIEKINSTIPIIVSFRGYDASSLLSRKSYVKKIHELLLRKNVHTTFVCDFLRQNLMKYAIHVPRFIILHSGTKLDTFDSSKINLDKEVYIFLQIASFYPYKGQQLTVRAFKKAIEKNPAKKIKLILAGGGPTLDSVKKLSIELGIEKHIEFTGWIEHKETVNLLSKANAFVHHSVTIEGKTEGIPNALMEAMAMELPVISTNHAGIAELVTNEVNGFLVDEFDLDTYADKMVEITNWPTRLKINREKVESDFEFSIHMKKLQDYYTSIYKGKN